MFQKLLGVIRNPIKILLYSLKFRIFRILTDSFFLKIKYRLMLGGKLNLNEPITFNEKIQWLKLFDRNPLYKKMVDKYEVRDLIKEKMGNKYLIPTIGVYESFEDIEFSSLPNQFVLKPNHTSGDIFICKDKTKINLKELERMINKWIKTDYFWVHREWPYKKVSPKVICEQFLVEETGEELKDYKFMCFNGEVKFIMVCSNRNSRAGLNIDIYDLNWELMPFGRTNSPNSGNKAIKPINFNEMIKYSEILSEGTPFLRVDFYEINGQLYFGELTLYPSSGFEEFSPQSYNTKLGKWIDLSISYNISERQK